MATNTPPGGQGWVKDSKTGEETWTAGKEKPLTQRRMGIWTAWRLSFVAGLVDIVGGAAEIWLATLAGTSITWFGYKFTGLSFYPLGASGVAVGVLVEVFAFLILLRPEKHRSWGKWVIALSGIGFVACLYGGLFVGLILGVAGGLLGMKADPTPEVNDPRRLVIEAQGKQP